MAKAIMGTPQHTTHTLNTKHSLSLSLSLSLSHTHTRRHAAEGRSGTEEACHVAYATRTAYGTRHMSHLTMDC